MKDAREEYTRLYQAYHNGGKPPYTQSFQFEVAAGNTGDPDVATIRRE